ncbi:nucleolar complex protein 14 [Lithohypha guttulata]|uniref:nucleolar complex protein 14 n=1 Tax=Lithohypha guttulata TaxID=1690604 RepID=UPI002DDE4181|nr:nucleolar complex protein 14 [Lithohypha guttulata]
MAPSQLKQLKASLREGGILGPQKSKKQLKSNNKDAAVRLRRNAALEGIRERFNPFEVKAPSRTPKFDISSNKPVKRTIERPGVTRGLGEERRRETLLKEMQSRNKVGGMRDRRFGEDDPTMTPEQKAAERFARQALRGSRKNDMFNLEEDEDTELSLTHGGRALDFGDDAPMLKDDYDEDEDESDVEDFNAVDDRPRKRLRLDGDEDMAEDGNDNDVPQRKKSKNEVMQEVIAKSKAYKAARQAQKEDDDDLRAELDQGLGDLFAALQGKNSNTKHQLPSPPTTDSEPSIDPGRAAMLAGKSREEAEKEYEKNIRQMKLDARSKPSTRTKTEEEKAAEEKARLEELERNRLRRMRGEAESTDDEDDDDDEAGADLTNDDQDDAEMFGLAQPQPRYIPQLEVEDEDQFVMDDIIASDSEADLASDFEGSESSALQEPVDDGDDDFINGLVLPPKPTIQSNVPAARTGNDTKELPFTFSCPQDVEQIRSETKGISAESLPTAVQRIRALYHKGLAKENTEKLGKFAQALVSWVVDLVDGKCEQSPSMQVIEQLIRHVHSMAKAQPLEVAAGFRQHFRRLLEDNRTFTPGDLVLLTAVATIFPTSDQWHSVVTPAALLVGRFLAQSPLETLTDLATGTYVCSIALRYQAKSERYVPEAVVFMCKAISLLAPVEGSAAVPKETPTIQHSTACRIARREPTPPAEKLDFNDLRALSSGKKPPRSTITPESLLLILLKLSIPVVDYYTSKSAFPELISPLNHLVAVRLSHPKNLALLHKSTQSAVASLSASFNTAIELAISTRKPLYLHAHRPLAIKSAYPLFSDNYNPERRQRDPDEERAELNKLKNEHKKERKGAMRELRKDANFMAREQLREKKAKDEAYDKKFKRLVAEIQGEEGREAKEYEREKAKRKGRF